MRLEDYPDGLRQARAAWRLVATLVLCLIMLGFGIAYVAIGSAGGQAVGFGLIIAAGTVGVGRLFRYGRILWPSRFARRT
jgi:hypothetical protein